MLKQKPGLAIVETIMVIAISGLLFALVIGTFATRRRAATDDAARQVMSEIARVRNQAQQGYGTTGSDTPAPGNELFGIAIEFKNNSGIMKVKYLQQNIDAVSIDYKKISTLPTEKIIPMPADLKWYIVPKYTTGTGCLNEYNSCFLAGEYMPADTVWLVFRNNTGQSYLLSDTTYTNMANYNSTNQNNIRLAFALPGSGSDFSAQINSSTSRYYAKFDLSIPNNQSLEVNK